MKKLSSDIKIAKSKYSFKGAVNCEVISTWDALTDTAVLTIPKKIQWQGKPLVFSDNPVLKKGNDIKISFGLDNVNTVWFDGYMTQIHAGKEVKIDCQDAMYILKTGEFTNSYESVKLSTLMRDMIGTKLKYEVVADFDLGQLRISKVTPAQVLESLRKDYFVKSFFRDGVLYVGLAVVTKLQKTHKIKYVIDNSLEYVKAEDTKLKIKGVILNAKNEKKEIEVGDSDGETRTIHAYNISETEMKKLCENEMQRLRYSGFRGSFTTFIQPHINHGDIVKLPTLYDVDTEGSYLVKKVVRSFNGTEARQTIELERKI